MIAADANALVYALVPGQLTPSATAWLARHEVVLAPPLVLDEVRSAMLDYVRRGVLSLADAVDVVAQLRAQVNLVEPPDDATILQTAWDRRLTAYDAAHVATALAHDVKLLTADKVILGRCKDVAVDVRVGP